MGGRVFVKNLSKSCGLVEQQTGKPPQLGHEVFPKAEPSFDDKQLEFVSWKNLLHMGLGNGKKVAQSHGPFEIKFREEVKPKNTAYF